MLHRLHAVLALQQLGKAALAQRPQAGHGTAIRDHIWETVAKHCQAGRRRHEAAEPKPEALNNLDAGVAKEDRVQHLNRGRGSSPRGVPTPMVF